MSVIGAILHLLLIILKILKILQNQKTLIVHLIGVQRTNAAINIGLTVADILSGEDTGRELLVVVDHLLVSYS